MLHCWKAYEICYKPYNTTNLTLGMLLQYREKLKMQVFYIYSTDMQENANKLHVNRL